MSICIGCLVLIYTLRSSNEVKFNTHDDNTDI